MEVVGQSGAVNAPYEFLGVGAVVVVYNATYSYIGAYHQRLGQGKQSVTATAPVVVLHFPTVHGPYAAGRLYLISGINHAIVERHHDRRCLETEPGSSKSLTAWLW